MIEMALKASIPPSETWFIGEDKTITFEVDQSDGSTAQVMTGWGLTWELLDSAQTPVVNAKISKTVGSGIAIGNGDGTDSKATVTIADDDTENLEAKIYYHQIRRTDAGSEQILAFGPAHLRKAPE